MFIPRPLCTLFQRRITNQRPTIQHVIQHRRTMWLLAFSILFDSAIIIVPTLGVVHLIAIVLGIPEHTLAVPAAFILPIVMLGWNVAWIEQNTPVFATFLWGGAIYIIEDPSRSIGITINVDVAEHPSVGGVVEAVLPGMLIWQPAELRQFKPSYTHAQIHWSEAAITEAITRQRAYRLNWD